MPQDPRRDGAVWPPPLRHLPKLRERRSLRQIRDLHRGGGERLVAVRPDIGTEQAHRQVDVGGPSPDATQSNELSANGVVRQARERGQVEAVQERRGQVARVARLLPAEADRSELQVVDREEAHRRRHADRHDQSIERCLRGREGHLLLQDQVDERRVARVSRPERRRPEPFDRSAEHRVGVGQAPRTRSGGFEE